MLLRLFWKTCWSQLWFVVGMYVFETCDMIWTTQNELELYLLSYILFIIIINHEQNYGLNVGGLYMMIFIDDWLIWQDF